MICFAKRSRYLRHFSPSVHLFEMDSIKHSAFGYKLNNFVGLGRRRISGSMPIKWEERGKINIVELSVVASDFPTLFYRFESRRRLLLPPLASRLSKLFISGKLSVFGKRTHMCEEKNRRESFTSNSSTVEERFFLLFSNINGQLKGRK